MDAGAEGLVRRPQGEQGRLLRGAGVQAPHHRLLRAGSGPRGRGNYQPHLEQRALRPNQGREHQDGGRRADCPALPPTAAAGRPRWKAMACRAKKNASGQAKLHDAESYKTALRGRSTAPAGANAQRCTRCRPTSSGDTIASSKPNTLTRATCRSTTAIQTSTTQS